MSWLHRVLTALMVPPCLAALVAPAWGQVEKPLELRWRPDDNARGVVELADPTPERHSLPNLEVITRAPGAARTEPLPRAGEQIEVRFTYRSDASVKASLIVQSLTKTFAGKDWLMRDLPPAPDGRAVREVFKLDPDAAHVILRVKLEHAGKIAIDGFHYADRPVQHRIVAGRVGVGPTIDAAADNRPVASMEVRLLPPSPQPWKQVFVGGAGTVRTIKVHPRDGTVVTGSDVSGPFYWDARSRLPPNPTMPTTGFPDVPWTMQPTAWRATLDAFGREDEGLIHTDQIAFDPGDPNVLYFAGGKQWRPGSGILITRDRGRTWTRVQLLNPEGKPVFIDNASSGERLIVDPRKSSHIYYGSRRDGLYRSIDSGATWQRLDGFAPDGAQPVDYNIPWIQFADLPGKRVMILAAGGNKKDGTFKSGVFVSIDDGQTFTRTDWPVAGLGQVEGTTLYLSSKRVHKVDLASGDVTEITPLELGPGKGKGWDYSPVAVSSENPDWLCVFTREYSEGRFFRSKDGGKTWQSFHSHDHRGPSPKMTFQCAPYYPTLGEHTFNAVWDTTFDRNKPSRLWLATWPGVVMTDDAWAEKPVFRAMIEGHEEVCLFDMISPSRGVPLVSGMMDVGGFVHERLDMPPATGMLAVDPDGPHGQRAPLEVTSIDFCETQPEVIVTGVCWRYTPPPDGFGTGHARISTDGGNTWRKFPGEAAKGAKDGRIAINAQDPKNIVWMPRLDNDVGVYFTRDAGQTWTPSKGAPTGLIWPDLVFTFYKPLAADRTTGGQFYIYDKRDGRFYRSSDGGANWSHVARLPAVGAQHHVYHRVAAVPGQAGHVWAALEAKGLFVSTDGGTGWTKLDGVEYAVDVAFGPSLAPGGAMACYFIGRIAGESDPAFSVYRSDDQGKTWTKLDGPDLGFASVVCLTADRQIPGRVYIGTNGRGIYFSERR